MDREPTIAAVVREDQLWALSDTHAGILFCGSLDPQILSQLLCTYSGSSFGFDGTFRSQFGDRDRRSISLAAIL